jgi:hypothetical protein
MTITIGVIASAPASARSLRPTNVVAVNATANHASAASNASVNQRPKPVLLRDTNAGHIAKAANPIVAAGT